jgi:hypothetical protein
MKSNRSETFLLNYFILSTLTEKVNFEKNKKIFERKKESFLIFI